MKVFKFGGASVKDATALRNMAQIISQFAPEGPLLVVVSAMGKTTNNLETLYIEYRKGGEWRKVIDSIQEYHTQIAHDLFGADDEYMVLLLNRQFERLQALLEAQQATDNFDEGYDQIISFGELISTHIVSSYLIATGVKAYWADARQYIQTDSTYREGKVDQAWTEQIVKRQMVPLLQHSVVITQGFIAGTVDNKTTTLGREGSDYSAAIFAGCLNADSVTIWKDVPGIMTGDPKRVPGAVLFQNLSFEDAAEMTYYGATVIHPKTIRPLANKNIPLYVRSFLDWRQPGTHISAAEALNDSPAIIFKDNQRLISLHTQDYAFITESDIIEVLKKFSRLNIKINLMQNSALSASICVDENPERLENLLADLSSRFEVKYNEGLTLITVMNSLPDTTARLTAGKEVLLEQITRRTWQGVLAEK